MSRFLESLEARPLSHKIGIWVGSLIFITFIFWQYLYSKSLEELQTVEAAVEKLNAEISHEKRLARNLGKFRAEVQDLELKLKFALQELPDKREIPDLLSSVSTLARDAGLEVSLFKPGPEVNKEFYAEVPVSILVDGTFHQVATFFDEVGQLNRIVNIKQIWLKEAKVTKADVRIKADCVATTFRYLDESERIKVDVKGSAKKRRGKKKE